MAEGKREPTGLPTRGRTDGPTGARWVAVTHDGRFHADDAFCAALLRILRGDAVEIRRTRDPGAIAAADVAFDVGGAFDPTRLRFDHHMPGAPARPSGTPYSALGQMWAHLGRDVVESVWPGLGPEGVEAAWREVDAGLVTAVDEVDNGRREDRPDGVSTLVAALWRPTDPEGSFAAAVGFARLALRGVVEGAAEGVAARQRVAMAARAAARSREPRVLDLVVHARWEAAVFDLGLDDLLYVVAPRHDGSWGVTCVPPERGSMAQRRPLPAPWAGLRDAGLAAASGVPDAVFCHANRFMAVAGSREGALALAGAALQG